MSVWCALCLACRWGVALQIISIIPHFHSEVVSQILIGEHTWSFVLPHLQGQCTHHLWALPPWIPRYYCSVHPKTNCCCRCGRILGSEDIWGSWADVNIFDRINTEMWEMINAFLSCSHSFPDVSFITSYHFNMAIWHSSGNCPSVTVHLSPFRNIRI